MADVKISQLTSATTPLVGTEVLPIVQSGNTVKVANNDLRPKQIQSNATSGVLQITGPAAAAIRVMTTPDANFTAARTDAAQSFTGDQTLSTGNLIQGTAAKGFNFTANTPASGMTGQLLNWYETGTWTPTYTPASGAFGSITYNTNTYGRYTRIGNVVVVLGIVVTDVFTIGTAAGLIWIDGLPFTPATSASAAINYSANFTINNPSGGYTSGNRIYPTYRTTANGGSTGIQAGDLANGSFGNYIIFQATYVV